MRTALALTILMTSPAFGQEPAQTGGVAQLVFAHDLYAFAHAHQDPLTMLAATKLAGAVELRLVEREVKLVGTANAKSSGADVVLLTAGQMQDAARKMVDPDETLASLFEESRVENVTLPKIIVQATPLTLGIGQSATWQLPFDGGVVTEIGMLGNGTGPLTLALQDTAGMSVCLSSGVTDRAVCAFAPAESSFYSLTISNPGPGENTLWMLVN